MRHGALKPHEADIIAWNIAGVVVGDQLQRLADRGVTVTQQALHKFRTKHAAEIQNHRDDIKSVVLERAAAITIIDQGERLRRLGVLADDLESIRTERGLMATEYRNVAGTIIEHDRFDAALVREYRGILHDVAVETGQIEQTPLPPTGDVQTEVHATFQTLVVTDPEYRELAQRLFVRAAMGASDASGASLVRKRRGVEAGPPPDADQRRAAADRLG